jgi:hypothetical protein
MAETHRCPAMWSCFRIVANTGLVAALPLSLSARPKRKSDRRRHERSTRPVARECGSDRSPQDGSSRPPWSRSRRPAVSRPALSESGSTGARSDVRRRRCFARRPTVPVAGMNPCAPPGREQQWTLSRHDQRPRESSAGDRTVLPVCSAPWTRTLRRHEVASVVHCSLALGSASAGRRESLGRSGLSGVDSWTAPRLQQRAGRSYTIGAHSEQEQIRVGGGWRSVGERGSRSRPRSPGYCIGQDRRYRPRRSRISPERQLAWRSPASFGAHY